MEDARSVVSGGLANLLTVILPYILYKFCKRVSESKCSIHNGELDFSLPTIRDLEAQQETLDDLRLKIEAYENRQQNKVELGQTNADI